VGSSIESWIAVAAAAGVIAGLWLLVRGLGSYRSTTVVADTSTSAIGSIAAGEVRVSGVVEAAEVVLVSLLQSVPCVYYRSTIGDEGEASDSVVEQRAIGFRVRDATGSLRVFPRDARVDAPVRFEAGSGLMNDGPVGLSIRRGGSTRPVIGDPAAASAAAAAALVTVQVPGDRTDLPGSTDRHGRRRYRETRLEPGDQVTIVGWALPFSDLSDPAEADLLIDAVAPDDPEVAADLAAARAAGTLADDPGSAWGNAAIPGFGIGRPVSEPRLEPGAAPMPLAAASEAERVERTFDIAAETLVLAASRGAPLAIAYGSPGAVVARGQRAFLVGLLGAVLAIASAMVFAINLDGGFGR
jgi:hypothetical protein